MARIIIVDDEVCCRRVLAAQLASLGHTVVAIGSSGMDAIKALFLNKNIDLVISDYSMGAGLNGAELSDCINHAWPGLHFLLVSGNPPENFSGHVLEKPISQKILAETIDAILTRTKKTA